MPTRVHRRRAAATIAFFQYMGFGLNAIKGLVLVPIYLRYFSFSMYGAWLASATAMQMLSSLDGGLTMVLMQRLATAHGANNREVFSSYYGTGIFLYFLFVVGMILIGLAVAPFVPSWVHAAVTGQRSLETAISLAVVGFGLTLSQELVLVAPMAWQKPLVPGMIRVSAILCNIVTTLIGLVTMRSVVALGIGNLVSGLLGLIAATLYVSRVWKSQNLPRPSFLRSGAKDILTTSFALLVNRVAGAFVTYGESFIVAVLSNPTAAGVLAVTSRLIRLAQAIAGPVAQFVYAGLAHVMGERGPGKIRNLLEELFGLSAFLTGIFIPMALALDKSFVALWVGANRFGGVTLAILVSAASVLLVRLNALGMVVPALGEISQGAWCGIGEMVIRIPLMILLVWKFGIIGIPIAALMSGMLVLFPTLHWVMVKKIGVTWLHGLKVQKMGVYGLGSAFLFGAITAWRMPVAESWGILCVQAAIVSTVVVIIMVSLETSQLRLIRRQLRLLLSHRALRD